MFESIYITSLVYDKIAYLCTYFLLCALQCFNDKS